MALEPAVPAELTPADPAPAPAAPAPAPPSAPETSAAAAPAPAPEPEPARGSGDPYDAIATYFPDVYDEAVAIADCESGMDPNAVNAGNYGLFQISDVHRDLVESMGYSWDQILDPYVNADVARALYDGSGGWGPWTCRRVL